MQNKDDAWNPPKIWDGGSCWIIGGGPSVKHIDFDPIKLDHVIGVNNGFELGSWVDICWFGDNRWFDWNKELLRPYGGIIATCATRDTITNHKRLKFFIRDTKRAAGICTKPGQVHWSFNSGSSAINLAYHLGVKKIGLIGFDMTVRPDGENGGHNWHDRHKLKHTPMPNIYQNRFIPTFKYIKEDAKSLGIEIINANMESELEVFPKMTFEDAVQWMHT